MTTTTYTIEISGDNDEGEQFAEWLNARGHRAKVGRTSGNVVNGSWTSNDTEANDVMNDLWSQYCNG